ncbi:MAG: M15 family metallopeptidase [Clostridiales bacterium]
MKPAAYYIKERPRRKRKIRPGLILIVLLGMVVLATLVYSGQVKVLLFGSLEQAKGQTEEGLDANSDEDQKMAEQENAEDQEEQGAKEDVPPEPPLLYAFPQPVAFIEGGKTYQDELVDVRLVIPGIQVNMLYATEDNFTGQVLYPLDLCLLQKGTAEKLKKAQAILAAGGYQLLITDAYRPFSVQLKMFELIGNSAYLANPHRSPSNHNRGAAVDVTLLDSEGNPLEMPSAIDTFDATAHRAYNPGPGQPPRSQAAKDNMDYLTKVMVECGFTTIKSEWWHYDDKDAKSYPATDRDFLTIPLKTLDAE